MNATGIHASGTRKRRRVTSPSVPVTATVKPPYSAAATLSGWPSRRGGEREQLIGLDGPAADRGAEHDAGDDRGGTAAEPARRRDHARHVEAPRRRAGRRREAQALAEGADQEVVVGGLVVAGGTLAAGVQHDAGLVAVPQLGPQLEGQCGREAVEPGPEVGARGRNVDAGDGRHGGPSIGSRLRHPAASWPRQRPDGDMRRPAVGRADSAADTARMTAIVHASAPPASAPPRRRGPDAGTQPRRSPSAAVGRCRAARGPGGMAELRPARRPTAPRAGLVPLGRGADRGVQQAERPQGRQPARRPARHAGRGHARHRLRRRADRGDRRAPDRPGDRGHRPRASGRSTASCSDAPG